MAFSAFRFCPPLPPATVAHGEREGHPPLTCYAGSLLLVEPARADEICGLYGIEALEPLSEEQLSRVTAELGMGPVTGEALVAALADVDPRTVGAAVQRALGVY